MGARKGIQNETTSPCYSQVNVITPADRFVYLVHRESVDVSVVDLASKTVIATIPLGSLED